MTELLERVIAKLQTLPESEQDAIASIILEEISDLSPEERDEQAFVKETQRKHYPDEVTRNQLQQTWQTLGLSGDDVRAIESQIIIQINSINHNLNE